MLTERRNGAPLLIKSNGIWFYTQFTNWCQQPASKMISFRISTNDQVSRHQGGPIRASYKPLTVAALLYRGDQGGSSIGPPLGRKAPFRSRDFRAVDEKKSHCGMTFLERPFPIKKYIINYIVILYWFGFDAILQSKRRPFCFKGIIWEHFFTQCVRKTHGKGFLCHGNLNNH